MSLLTSMFSFPKEVYRKKNYTVLNVELDKFKAYDIEGDFLAVLYSNADTSKVYIGFNTQDPMIPLNVIAAGVVTPFSRLYIKCETSEVGKKIIFIIGQEAKFTISTQGITIQSDNVGLAKDSTLKNALTPVSSVLINADETISQSVVLDTEFRSLVSIYAKADAATNFYIDLSVDNVVWFNDVITYSSTTLVNDVIRTAFRYVRLRSDAAGVSGNKVTLVLAAKSGG